MILLFWYKHCIVWIVWKVERKSRNLNKTIKDKGLAYYDTMDNEALRVLETRLPM